MQPKRLTPRRLAAMALAALLLGVTILSGLSAGAPPQAEADAHRIAIAGMPSILTEGRTYNIQIQYPCKGDLLQIVERHSTAEAADTTWSDDTPDFELNGCGTRAITFTAEQDTDTDDERFIVWIHSGKTVGAGNRGRVSPIYEFVIRDDDAKPAKPTRFNAAPQEGKAVLTWDKPVHPAVTTWELKQGTAAWATITPVDDATGTNSLKHEVTGLTNGTTYTFWLRGTNSNGTGPISPSGSSGLAVTPRKSAYTPVSPPNLKAVGLDGKVELTWTQPSGGAIRTYGYRYRASTATSWGAWGRTDSTAPRFTVGSLTNGTEYVFQIRALQGAHVGPESEVAVATPNPKPGHVGNFYVEGSNAATMLRWTAADRATGYQYRQHVGTGGTTFGAWKDAGTDTFFEVTGLTNSSSHHFQVRAINGAGGGPISDEIQSTPLAARVSQVRNLRLTAVGGTVIQIAWDAPARGTPTRYSHRHPLQPPPPRVRNHELEQPRQRHHPQRQHREPDVRQDLRDRRAPLQLDRAWPQHLHHHHDRQLNRRPRQRPRRLEHRRQRRHRHLDEGHGHDARPLGVPRPPAQPQWKQGERLVGRRHLDGLDRHQHLDPRRHRRLAGFDKVLRIPGSRRPGRLQPAPRP